MPDWLKRYKAGESAPVWAEMEALGPEIAKPANSKAAAAVVKETMTRARKNVLILFDELQKLGYKFESSPPAETDFPLELRLEAAVEFVKRNGGPEYRANPFAHPALAWVEEEDIEPPERFRNGRPGRANYRPGSARLLEMLRAHEASTGSVAPLAVRGWFEFVGCVNLKGSHPRLNREGSVEALRVLVEESETAPALQSGEAFVTRVRHAFEWAGLPGWSTADHPPAREIAYLRSKLLPL